MMQKTRGASLGGYARERENEEEEEKGAKRDQRVSSSLHLHKSATVPSHRGAKMRASGTLTVAAEVV